MRKRLVAILILVIVLCSFFTQVLAEDTGDLSDLYKRQEEIKKQTNEATTKLELVQEELSESLIQIQNLNTSITDYEGQLDNLNQDILELEQSIDDIEGRLEIAQQNYDSKKKTIDERLISIYEDGETRYLNMLLSARSISDLISNYYLATVLIEYDTMFLEQINNEKEAIEKNKEKLENDKQVIEIRRKEKETTAVILQNTLTMKNNYMSKLSEEELQIQQEIETYQEELNKIEKEILQAVLENLGPEYVGGKMAWPIPGYTRITSKFGMRTHPITGLYKLHSGLDVGAPRGANFVAANDGVVIKVSQGGAYGKMVMIDHGGGITTLYAHGSEILVEKGQAVLRGEPILKVGSTGYSTGPHAHFEVRINNKPVDPLPYITNTGNKTQETNANTVETKTEE